MNNLCSTTCNERIIFVIIVHLFEFLVKIYTIVVVVVQIVQSFTIYDIFTIFLLKIIFICPWCKRVSGIHQTLMTDVGNRFHDSIICIYYKFLFINISNTNEREKYEWKGKCQSQINVQMQNKGIGDLSNDWFCRNICDVFKIILYWTSLMVNSLRSWSHIVSDPILSLYVKSHPWFWS